MGRLPGADTGASDSRVVSDGVLEIEDDDDKDGVNGGRIEVGFEGESMISLLLVSLCPSVGSAILSWRSS
jgi:hypothetical protein